MESRLTTFTPLQLLERGKINEARERFDELEGLDRDLAEGCYLAFTEPERAKDLLSRVITGTSDERREKALIWQGCAYWAIGEIEEARASLDCVNKKTDDLKFVWAFTRAPIEQHHYKLAMSFLKRVAHLLDEIDNPLWKGKFYYHRAFFHNKLRKRDKAIVDYEAAMYWYEQNDDPARVANVKNNLAGIYRDVKDFPSAHRYVDEAIAALKGAAKAQAYDQKAGIYIAEKKYAEGETWALKSIRDLENTDRKELLVESIVTLAQCVSGLGRHSESSGMLDRAAETARYLNNHDLLIFVLQGRIKAATIAIDVCRQESVRIAVETTSSTRLAANKLNVSHAAVIEYQSKHKKTD